MKNIVFLTVLVFVGCSNHNNQAAQAPQPASTTAPIVQNASPASELQKWLCVKGQDKRELEIVKKDNGCGLNYTQDGKIKEETAATHGLKLCEKSEKKILAKLKKSGYQCS